MPIDPIIIDRATLTELSEEAERRGYNRQLNTDAVRLLDDDQFLLEPLLLHEHINGHKVETNNLHFRCVIHLMSHRTLGFLDVPITWFTRINHIEE